MSEVENKAVIQDLINTGNLKNGNYGISHFDSPDARGIDVALIYRKDFFKVLNEKSHFLELYNFNSGKPYYSRDQLVVDGLLEGERMFFIVNHWPSRSADSIGISCFFIYFKICILVIFYIKKRQKSPRHYISFL